MENVIVIAGPSGSGKTSVGFRVPEILGYYHFDVGLLWRYLALRLIAHRVDSNSEIACATEASRLLRLAERLDYWSFHGLLQKWFDNGVLERPGLAEVASKCASYPSVRQVVADILHSFYTPAGYVVVGRPWLYEVVFPGAFFKVLLVAPEAERAQRNREGESRDQMAARDERDHVTAITMEQLAKVDMVINTFGRDPEVIALQIAVAACPLIPVQHKYVPQAYMGVKHVPWSDSTP